MRPALPRLGRPDDEWRPLTVLACQLVGISEQATPRHREARLEVVRDCHAMWTEIIQRFDGHLAQRQGGRLLVYFGYPQAHEDDAHRAVLAGLGMVEGMVALNRHPHHDRGVRLAVQVGIHTGVELVGAMGRGDQRAALVVGETPTMVAGLQRLAAPDTVVISPATWRLVDGYFLCEVLGMHLLEDLSEPLTVYRVLQESTAHNRLEVAIRRGLTPFVGREFSYALIQAVAPVEEARLQQGLMQLVDTELLYQRGLPPQAQYTFKHVLIQEAAYQSLLRSTRQRYHRQIAQVLETRFPNTREAHPELLAYHYTEAGLGAQAVPYWQRAGQHAFERSAMIEAVGHLTKGLELLKTLPETPERHRQELTPRALTPLTCKKPWRCFTSCPDRALHDDSHTKKG